MEERKAWKGEYDDDHTFEYIYSFWVNCSSMQWPNFPCGSDMLNFTMG